MGGDLLTFDEALAELQMATHELRSLVAQGEIRAFRDEDVLKFRRTDVLDLKKTRDVEPGGLVIEPQDIGDDAPTLAEPEVAEQEPPGPAVKPVKRETEETELLTGIGSVGSTDFLGLDDTTASPDGGDTAQTVVPTIEISDEDMIDDTAQTVIPSISTDEETDVIGIGDTAPAPGPSLLEEEDEATEMATQEITPDEVVAATAPASLASEEPTAESPLRFQDASVGADAESDELGITTDDVAAAGAASGMTAPRRSQQYLAEAAVVTISPVFLVIAVLTFVVLLLAIPIFYGVATDSPPAFEPYKGLVEFLGQKTIK